MTIPELCADLETAREAFTRMVGLEQAILACPAEGVADIAVKISIGLEMARREGLGASPSMKALACALIELVAVLDALDVEPAD